MFDLTRVGPQSRFNSRFSVVTRARSMAWKNSSSSITTLMRVDEGVQEVSPFNSHQSTGTLIFSDEIFAPPELQVGANSC